MIRCCYYPSQMVHVPSWWARYYRLGAWLGAIGWVLSDSSVMPAVMLATMPAVMLATMLGVMSPDTRSTLCDGAFWPTK